MRKRTDRYWCEVIVFEIDDTQKGIFYEKILSWKASWQLHVITQVNEFKERYHVESAALNGG